MHVRYLGTRLVLVRVQYSTRIFCTVHPLRVLAHLGYKLGPTLTLTQDLHCFSTGIVQYGTVAQNIEAVTTPEIRKWFIRG